MGDTVIGTTGDRGETVATGKGINQQRVDVQTVRDHPETVNARLTEIHLNMQYISRRVDELGYLSRDLQAVQQSLSKLINIESEFERRQMFFEKEYDKVLGQQQRETDKRIESLWKDFNERITKVYMVMGGAILGVEILEWIVYRLRGL